MDPQPVAVVIVSGTFGAGKTAVTDEMSVLLQEAESRTQVAPGVVPATTRPLADELEAAAVEDFAVSNDGRPVREVAEEILDRLGWT
jgi:Ni2+-binding GTPase involved in maturation of urease and hydrogenase